MYIMRYLVNGGRVQVRGGKCSSVVSSSKFKDKENVKEDKEIVGGSLDNNELTRRLNALNIKKPNQELKTRLMNVDPKKKLINFTI